jgi:hypothetical protein
MKRHLLAGAAHLAGTSRPGQPMLIRIFKQKACRGFDHAFVSPEATRLG